MQTDFLLELYKYFAKFPKRSAIDEFCGQKATALKITDWQTKLETLTSAAEIDNYAEEILPEIEYFTFDAKITDSSKQKARTYGGIWLLVNWVQMRNFTTQANTQTISGVVDLQVSLFFPSASRHHPQADSLEIDNELFELMRKIYAQIIEDKNTDCEYPQAIETTVNFYPTEMLNFSGITMDLSFILKQGF